MFLEGFSVGEGGGGGGTLKNSFKESLLLSDGKETLPRSL